MLISRVKSAIKVQYLLLISLARLGIRDDPIKIEDDEAKRIFTCLSPSRK
jgi:hypothetical protein